LHITHHRHITLENLFIHSMSTLLQYSINVSIFLCEFIFIFLFLASFISSFTIKNYDKFFIFMPLGLSNRFLVGFESFVSFYGRFEEDVTVTSFCLGRFIWTVWKNFRINSFLKKLTCNFEWYRNGDVWMFGNDTIVTLDPLCSGVACSFVAWSQIWAPWTWDFFSPRVILPPPSGWYADRVNHYIRYILSKRPQQTSADKICSRKFQTFDATVSNCTKILTN